MNEEKLLNKIFGGENLKWRGYEIDWCDHCQTHIILCEKCQGTNCNCMCCDFCRQDQEDFKALHPFPGHYLSEKEKRAVEKYLHIKKLLSECLVLNQSFDPIKCKERGQLSDHECKMFKLPPYTA